MTTEAADERYRDLDRWPLDQAVQAMWEGQMAAVAALASASGVLAEAAAAAASRLRAGGRLVYVGAGTSGRIAIQDGVELTPTFDWPEDRLVFLMAGGDKAVTGAVEGAEDDREAARAAIAGADVGPSDVVIGVAASGRTPFTCAALEAAREAGALTVAMANNSGAPLLALGDHAVLLDTGAEVLAGSTRMKAGTAQKAALNLFSTATMLALGRVYEGRMVAMRPTNAKLRVRANAMVARFAGVDAVSAEAALAASGNDIRRAVLVARGLAPAEAASLLEAHGGQLRGALEALDKANG
ncbi:N-acetylmuramic acid 6-phosphate etherase [Novosphingobium sp. PC22D]|uniref:N-acetylmuramic acid 6-phosphate etherase n=1 Tax=Novosphingobium sp. PC22D TaxID=1962403 RepID=UPI000BF09A4A|nr:N-acetylmuramic acid 6-phosphate etherase [Novosphingobium sp. PC22D]PEQ14340.1 N-acetylmuramic acid 6-phosphate etherase [Novosphingobium sp. PC22D]